MKRRHLHTDIQSCIHRDLGDDEGDNDLGREEVRYRQRPVDKGVHP